MDPELLSPHIRPGVDGIRDDPADGPECHVQKPEHGRPTPRSGLAQRGEILEVVCPQDGINSKLSAKGAEITARRDEGLRGENDRQGFFQGRVDDNFAARNVEHGLLAELVFVIVAPSASFPRALVVEFFAHTIAVRRAAEALEVACLVCQVLRNLDDGACNPMGREVSLSMQVAFAPFAGRGIGAA